MFSFRVVQSDDVAEWNSFVTEHDFFYGGLLQSWEWGEFQQSIGNTVLRFVARDKNGWIMTASVVELTLPFHKRIFYIPRGPIFHQQISIERQIQCLGAFISMFQEKYATQKDIFFRMDPPWKESDSVRKLLKKAGWYEAFRSIQPRETLFIPLEKNEEILWKELKQKTRYNIQVAKRCNVRVRAVLADDISSFEKFYQLLCETADRDHFFLHPKNYYKNMLQTKEKNSVVFQLFVAETEDLVHSGAIMGFFGRVATYLHGASCYESRAFMSPYMLHWEIILEAKRRYCRAYDLNGICDKKSPPSWEGITRFKRGFAPREQTFLNIGTWEFPLRVMWHTWYRVYDWWRHSNVL